MQRIKRDKGKFCDDAIGLSEDNIDAQADNFMQKEIDKNCRFVCGKVLIEYSFIHYYQRLTLFGCHFVGDIEVAKDLVQEVFMVLYEHQGGFVSEQHLKSYLYLSVKNKCLKYIRHEKVKANYSASYLEEVSEQTYSIDAYMEEEYTALLRKEIERLPKQCRKVFLLALQEKSNAEIASALGVGIETVKSHKKLGKQLLYRRLKGLMNVCVLCRLMGL